MRKTLPLHSMRIRTIASLRCITLLFTLLPFNVSSQTQLVYDLNKEKDLMTSEFGLAKEVNGIVYLPITNGLWKTNGTAGGSVEIKKFQSINALTNFNNQLYFLADDGINGLGLWKSNGTPQGTVQVKNIGPGSTSPFVESFVVVNNLMFFIAITPQHGKEVWRSDGTSAGTFLLRDIIRGPHPSNPSSLVAYKNKLFFTASDGIAGYELWSSDGSTAGTNLFKDVRPGKTSSTPGSLIVSGANLYFHAYTDTYGRELWKTDGTSGGTAMVDALMPGPNSGGVENLLDLNGTLYFTLEEDHERSPTFFKTDGTAAGTVEAFMPTHESYGSIWLHGAIVANGKIYFQYGDEFYESDGTQAGTRLLLTFNDFYSSTSKYVHNNILYLVEFDPYFNAPGAYGYNLWKIQNSVPTLFKTVRSGEFVFPHLSFTSNVGILFSAGNDQNKMMLWKSNGTSAGTVPFLDKVENTKGSHPSQMVQLNGNILFSASDSAEIRSLWSMHGKTTQIQLLKRMDPIGIALSGNRVYFTNNNELWQSNGTAAGTMLVRSFASTGNGPHYLTDVNGRLFFSGFDPAGGRELWKSEGGYASTVRVRDIYQGVTSSNPADLINFNGILLFTADHPIQGRSLWQSNGTGAGTTVILSANASHRFKSPSHLTKVNNSLFFFGLRSSTVIGLYRTNGTTAGTTLVKDIVPFDPAVNEITQVVGTDSRLYFFVRYGISDWDLWTSDGTSQGTYRLMDLPANTDGQLLQDYKGRMFFITRTFSGASKIKLWETTGTAASTLKVKTINTSYATARSIVFNNTLYFGLTKLWRTDGTECGTFIVPSQDGALIGMPYPEPGNGMIINRDRRIVFVGEHLYAGSELFRLEKANAPKSPCGEVSATSVVETYESTDVANFPNPFATQFTLRVNSPEDNIFSASIMSIAGKNHASMNDLRTNTDYLIGSELKSGIYLLKVTVGGRQSIRRIVKL